MSAGGPRPRPAGLVLLGYPYIPSPDTSRGIDHYLYYLAEGYRRRSIRLDIVDTGRFPDYAQQLFLGEPKIFSRVMRRPRGFWHAVSPVGGRVAALLGRHPLVTTIHDVMPFYMRRLHPARYRFLRASIEISCRRSDRIIVTFPSVGTYLEENLRVPAEKISLVPVGIDPGLVGAKAGPGPVPSGPMATDRVVFFGSWNPIDRGGDIAIRAMVPVLRERPSAKLLVACEGPDTPTLRRLVRELGLEKSVEFIGFVPEDRLAETFRSVTAMVAPSRLGFGILTMHAMYAGVPVVVTDVRDQGFFVGDAGIVCPPGDVEAIGTQLARILSDERFRAELARRGRAKVGEFSSDRMVEETLRVYAAEGWTPENGGGAEGR